MSERFNLCYVYINSKYSEREISLNLLNEYIFSVENNYIRARKNPKYLANLFGTKFESITSIVGENGSGKTSILSELLNLFEETYTGEYLIIYKINERYHYYSNYSLSQSKDEIIIDMNKGDLGDILENFDVIFYSNIYDLNTITKGYNRITDISTKRLSEGSNFDLYAQAEMEKQIFFTSIFQKDISLNNYIRVPETIFFKLNVREDDQFEKELDRMYEETDYGEKYFPKNKALFNNIILLILDKSTYDVCLKEIIYESSIDYIDSTLEYVESIIEKVVDTVEFEATDFSNFDRYVKGFFYDEYILSNKCLWQDKPTYNCSAKVHNSASSLGQNKKPLRAS